MKTRVSTTLLMAALMSGCALPPLTAPGGTSGPGGVSQPGTSAKPGAVPIVDPKTGKVLPNQPVEPLAGIEFRPLTQDNAKYLSNNGATIANNAGGLVGNSNAITKNAQAPTATAPAMAPQAGAAMADSASGESAVGRAAMPAIAPAPPSDVTIAPAGGGSAGTPAGGPGVKGAGGQYSGNVWSNYGFGYYFGYGGGSFDQMALVSVQQAETKGSKGSFQSIVGDIAAPIVKAWAADGRLTESGAVLANDGSVFVDPQGEGGGGYPYPMKGGPMMDAAMVMPAPGGGGGIVTNPNAWRLVYVSSERREMLSFNVSGEKTTIIRMRWAPLDLATERVLVDSSSAIKSLIGAITNKAFAGEEEKSGKDYFMGFPFEQPKTGEWDGDYQKTDVLYEVPKNARWSVSLQQVMGKVVWQLDWNAPWERPDLKPEVGVASAGVATPMGAATASIAVGEPMPMPKCEPMPMPEPEYYVNYYGNGMIDAETGAVIRFSRPTKVTYNYNRPQYEKPLCVQPVPLPAEKPPIAVPATEPTKPLPPDVKPTAAP